ncbi:alpha/beta hydrolase [Nocardioides convexus]|uniref:alpha/beta hydrolase n=1 Tax=Nocardioides convexus TaxID=2712224 RepID=UPI0024189903|nr:alpha/beta hydrolase [Nocardioides convexus]
MTRSDVTFPSGDGTCAGWLYEPAGAATPGPVVVLAHGLGGVKEMRLDAFAERFCAAGYRCLVFDYRHFGASSGEPRQAPRHRAAGWRTGAAPSPTPAPSTAPTRSGWSCGGPPSAAGTCCGRRHAIHASRRSSPSARSPTGSPPPSPSPRSPLPRSPRAPCATPSAPDAAGEPLMIPTYGPPGSTALMTSPDSAAGVEALVPAGMEVRSDVAARFALDIIRYFPGRDARRITVPVHFAVCEDDAVAPTRATLRHAARAPRGEVRMQPGGHFDIYVGADFEHNIAQQARLPRRPRARRRVTAPPQAVRRRGSRLLPPDRAGPPVRLGLVERGIGARDGVLDVVAGPDRADAETDGGPRAGVPLADGSSDVVGVGGGREQDELVPAEPAHQAARAEDGLADLPEVAQRLVPGGVAVAVVERLEVVEVGDDHRHRLAVPAAVDLPLGGAQEAPRG